MIWLVVSTPLKNISQLVLLKPIYGKTKNVPNHQPDMILIKSDEKLCTYESSKLYSPLVHWPNELASPRFNAGPKIGTQRVQGIIPPVISSVACGISQGANVEVAET